MLMNFDEPATNNINSSKFYPSKFVKMQNYIHRIKVICEIFNNSINFWLVSSIEAM